MDTRDLLAQLRALRDAHNDVLASVETARTRIVTVEALYEQLGEVSPARQELLRIAIGCVEQGYNRPAIVMAWAALFDRVAEILGADGFARLHAARPKWTKVASRDELVESFPESQIVDALENSGFVGKTLRKTLQGQLHVRNRAAHAGPYSPGFNATLGYIEDVLSTLTDLGSVA